MPHTLQAGVINSYLSDSYAKMSFQEARNCVITQAAVILLFPVLKN